MAKSKEIKQPENADIRHIPLTKRQVAIVDASDYDWLMQWKWCASFSGTCFYALRKEKNSSGKQVSVMMHNVILGIPTGGELQGNHRDGNGLNNRRSNLRIATQSQQRANQKKHCDALTSMFKGIRLLREGYWEAKCTCRGIEERHYFDEEEKAARGYDAMAYRLHGEFAVLNFEYKNGEIPKMPVERIPKKRGPKLGTRWKWAEEKRKSDYYPGEELRPPIPPRQASVEFLDE